MRRLLLVAATIGAIGVGSVLSVSPHASADTGAATTPPATATPIATGTPTTTTGTPTAAQIIATARQYLGFPYAYIGDDPSTGFSCIGLVHFVFAQNGVYVPEDLGAAYGSAPHVDRSALQPGDLVFFKNTVWDGISHVALYVGDGMMIAADSMQTGVEWDTLSDPYWQKHYLGATRPLSDPSGTPVNPAATPLPSGPSLAPQSQAGPNLNLKAGTTLSARQSATVYSGPGVTYHGIDTVVSNVTLTVVQTQGQWVNVSYAEGNQYGWVRGPDLNLAAAQAPSSQGSTRTGNGDAGAVVVTPPANGSNTGHGGNGSNSGNGGSQSGNAGNTSHAHVQVARSTRAVTPGQIVIVTAAVLFVRSGPSEQQSILRRVHAGDRLRVLSTSDGWDYVALRDNSRGWVSAAWVA